MTTALTYDADNRVLQTQQKSGATVLRTTSTTYTVTGKPATATDANGNVTSYAYDALDRLIRTTDAAGRVTQYTYDALGRPSQVFNPQIAGAIPGGALVRQTYTPDSLRASLTDANNNTTAFTYDGFDRLSLTTYPLGSTEALTYDADSNVVSRTTRAGQTIAYAYDTLNRLIAKTPPSPAPVVSYSYDLAGRLTGVSDTSATIPSIATPASTLTYTATAAYDALNRPTGITFGDVPAAAVPGTPVNVAFSHSYNAVNQRTGQSVTDNAWIEYPSVASSTNYTANALNQYTAVGAVTPTYDSNGNLLTDGTNTYTYAAENRLVSASNSGASATYTFDGRGRRTTKTVTSGGTTTTTVYVTGADNRELLEYNGATGAIQRWYAYGLGPNDVVAQMNVPAGTRATPIPDIQGSIIGSLSNAGALTVFAYRPFGSSAAPPATFGYTGQRYDPETGSYYYRARQFSAGWGRFLQPDPIGYRGGLNLYAYVGNDPLNALDPTGTIGSCSGDSAFCAAATGPAMDAIRQAATSSRISPSQQAALTAAHTLLSGPNVNVVFTNTLPSGYSGGAALDKNKQVIVMISSNIASTNSGPATYVIAELLVHEGAGHGADLLSGRLNDRRTVRQVYESEQRAYGLQQTFNQASNSPGSSSLWKPEWSIPENQSEANDAVNAAARRSTSLWQTEYRSTYGTAPPPMVSSGQGK